MNRFFFNKTSQQKVKMNRFMVLESWNRLSTRKLCLKVSPRNFKVEQWAAQHYNRRLANSGAAGFGSGFNGNGYPSPPVGAAAGSPFLGINGNPAATPGATVHHPPTAGATVRNSSDRETGHIWKTKKCHKKEEL